MCMKDMITLSWNSRSSLTIMKYVPLWMQDMLVHLRQLGDCLSFQYITNLTLLFALQYTYQGNKMFTFVKVRNSMHWRMPVVMTLI